MQIGDAPTSTNPIRVIGPSLVLELSWATHSAWSPGLRAKHPHLQALADEHPDVIEGLRAFWGDGTDCFTEFQVLGDVAGALEITNFVELFEALNAARTRIPPNLPLRSETESDREAVLHRLAQLRDDDDRWMAYMKVFRTLYAVLDTWWRSEGIPSVEVAVATARRELESGAEWTRMVSVQCELLRERLPEIVERRDPVVLAVCALFGKGLYLDLPAAQLIGLGANLGEYGARARTESLARRIRVLADPTRLAILDHLRSGPRSVGDIAVEFTLAQPTVSAHVKQLREAGLVTATRRGNRLELAANADALTSLAGDLTAVVAS
jgi:ArsR family transcriptional regulator